MIEKLIYGKSDIDRIVSIEVDDDKAYLYRELEDGTVSTEEVSNKYWILSPRKINDSWVRMKGSLYYKWGKQYSTQDEFFKARSQLRKYNVYSVYNGSEGLMLKDGHTYFKNMKPDEVSVLSFDIEAYGLLSEPKREVYIISNTYRNVNGIQKKLFSVDNYDSQYEMILDWAEWVREVNPSIITGHNIYGYDFPYLIETLEEEGYELKLGRDNSPISRSNYTGSYRVDGNTSWDYNEIFIHGREIVDTMFLSVKYDIGRNFPSWGLKPIIKHLGLEKEDRQHYDASKIKHNWSDPEEREKIKAYAADDGDDALALFDMMVPSYFYMAQSIPKPFQKVINGASGSWLNSIFVRAYLQDKYSIPAPSESVPFEGAISYGIPGVYNNSFKIDVASLYPSIMRNWELCDIEKDPKKYFPQVVEYFTIERLNNKKMANDTGDKYYRDLEQAQKIFINSLYGFLGASGLHFNSPENAAFVTRKGREILVKAMEWSTGYGIKYWEAVGNGDAKYEPIRDYKLVNCDTDSIMVAKNDESEWTELDKEHYLYRVNELFPELIKWEDDGYYPKSVILKAKNYILKNDKGKVKRKGSSITDSKKEPKMLQMIDEIIDSLLNDSDNLSDIYDKYVREACNVENIREWATKKTVSKAVLNPERTNEQKVLDAFNGRTFTEGEKIYVFPDIDGEVQAVAKGEPVFYKKDGTPKMIPNRILRLVEDYQGTYDREQLLKRVYNTFSIFNTVVDIKQFPKYHNKSGVKLLEKRGLI